MAAQRYLRYLVSKRYSSTHCIHSIRLRTNIKAAIFPVNFSISFRETTLLESNAGGPPCRGVPTAPGSLFPKKRKKAAAAQILGWGAGGKNSRKVGKWESGKVAKLRFLKFRDFSWISLLGKMLKSGISKAPPFDFSTNSRRPERL